MSFNAAVIQDFIGKGITLPLTLANGRPELKTGVELIRSSIRMILTYQYGVRFFLNEFGSRIDQFLEEPNDDVLESLIDTFVREAIGIWEPRVELLGVALERPNDMELNLKLYYRIVNTQLEDTFIFPFYSKIIY